MAFLETLARPLSEDEIDAVSGAGTPTCTITIGDTSHTYNDETGELIRICVDV